MDPKWLYRAALALVIAAFVVVIARMAILGMKPDTERMERTEATALGKTPQHATPPSR